MNKKFKFWCKGTSPNLNFQKAGWWTFPHFVLSKYYHGLEIFNCPHFEVCQWTGLLDKSGVEIYEGDIIKFINDNYPLNVVSWDRYKWASTCIKEGLSAVEKSLNFS